MSKVLCDSCLAGVDFAVLKLAGIHGTGLTTANSLVIIFRCPIIFRTDMEALSFASSRWNVV